MLSSPSSQPRAQVTPSPPTSTHYVPSSSVTPVSDTFSIPSSDVVSRFSHPSFSLASADCSSVFGSVSPSVCTSLLSLSTEPLWSIRLPDTRLLFVPLHLESFPIDSRHVEFGIDISLFLFFGLFRSERVLLILLIQSSFSLRCAFF